MFENRSVQGVENRQYGGINELANIISLKQGYALDMDNFEIDPTDAIRRRDGYTLTAALGSDLRYLGTYYTAEGDQVFVAVVDNKFWEATEITGPWTDRTGSLTLSSVDGPWIGADLGGRFVLINGTDAPITHKYGENAKTLKEASQVETPGNCYVIAGALAGVPTAYCVTAITARGETTASNQFPAAFNTCTTSAFNTVTWNLVAGAQGYKIYKYDGTRFVYLGAVGAVTSSYADVGQGVGVDSPPLTNTTSNTPTDWDNEAPTGVIVVARGRSQRMLIFHKSFFWCCAQGDPLNWLQPNDAFNQPVYGGRDNNIIAGGTLYDYTMLCSMTNTFVFSGSTYQDFNLVKILNVGCQSHHSIVSAGDDLYFWSEIGPNSFSRVMSGQDIQTVQDINSLVQNTVSSVSNREKWPKIVAWNHLRNNRLGWAYPSGTSTVNNKAMLLSYSGKRAWSRHSMPAIVNAVVDTLRFVYVGCADGNIYKLYSGNTDNGTVIPATYETGWYDSQSFLNRQITWLDVITDKTVGTYSLQVEVFFDFASTTNSVHALTESTTDGVGVVIQTALANIHRLYVKGFGRYFKFKFTVTSSPTAPRILGWRPEMYSKGTR